jgi:hypothetical protein
MSDDVRTLTVAVEIEDGGVKTKLHEIESAGDRAAGSLNKHVGAGARLSNTYTELSSKVNLLKQVWDTAADVLNAPINAAKEEAAANVELIAALTARGEATKENIAALNEYATKQSYALAIDDEAITGIQTYAMNLGKIALSDVPAFTQAVLQMSEVNGKSWESNEAALAKYVSGATPKIRGMNLEIDKSASAQDKLNAVLVYTEAGYTSLVDKASDFEGQQGRLNIVWDNFLAKLGGYITTSPAVARGLETVSGWIQKGVEWMEKNPDAIEKAGQKLQEWFASDGPVQGYLRDTAMIIEKISDGIRWISGNNDVQIGGGTYIDSEGNSQPFNSGNSWTGSSQETSRSSSAATAARGASSAVHIGSISDTAARAIAKHLNAAGSLQLAEAQIG